MLCHVRGTLEIKKTWALCIGLVKAASTVPREALFVMLRRFGITDNIVIGLKTSALIKMKMCEDDS